MQFIDLKRQYKEIENSVQRRIKTVLEHGNYILGPEIQELEQKLADYVGMKYCLTCSNGTDALLLPLMANKVGPGDAIFVPPFTFMATAEVVSLLGATPIFIDIDPNTYNIDPKKLESAIENLKRGITPTGKIPAGLKPRGIIPVDLFGLPAEYDSINRIAKEHGLFVIEDAAQSFGATYKGRKSGSLAKIAATSFFPAKPLGCYGDGGAIFTDDDDVVKILKSLRVHGQGVDKYNNVRIGINGRMDTIQAAVVLAKLEIFDEELKQRRIVAGRYSELLKEKASVPVVPPHCASAWAQYSIQSPRRNDIMERLKIAGIPTAIYYPKPLHLQDAFSYLGYEKGSMPESERAADNIFSLPMHPYLTEEDQVKIVKPIISYIERDKDKDDIKHLKLIQKEI
jgi:dTDP-4-amino-4,6-dideoxygalactose transaminase